MNTLLKLQQLIHEQIPLGRAMDLTVTDLQALAITLEAPLAANHNHAGTAFAGSLYSLASLAGWALLRHITDTHCLAAHLVLARADIRYLRPAHGDLRVSAHVSPDQSAALLEGLLAGKSVRMDIAMRLESAGERVASYSGRYVATPAASDGGTRA